MFRSAKNIIKNENISMFDEDFEERYDVEQYCWTKDTIKRLLKSLEFIENCCCLTTPSLGKGFFNIGRNEVVLDIDTRFNYLPKYRYFDIKNPIEQKETFEILIVDPPFFYLSMEQIFNAVLTVTKHNFNTKLLIGFLKREEKTLLKTFKKFNIKETNFKLEYTTAKPEKWKNYALYSNIDLPNIKRIPGKYGFKK